MLAVACVLAACWLVAAVVVAGQRGGHVLLGRAALILAAAYAAGAALTAWPWDAFLGPLVTWLGG